MTPDLAQTQDFLDALDPASRAFTFQFFPERADSIVLPDHPHGRLADLGELLVERNRQGAGIFVTVNRTDGRGRSAENIIGLRSLVIDCDTPRLRPLALPPSLSVETRPARGHHYWLLASGEDTKRFRRAQQQLATYYGSDLTICDLPRVFRLPGFYNVKAEPHLVQLLRDRRELRYTIDQVLAAHPLPKKQGSGRCAPTCATAAYNAWAREAPLTRGSSPKIAFRLALEGFRYGLAPSVVEAEVRAYCDRAGIGKSADAVLRSARTAAARRTRAAGDAQRKRA